jgi:transposase
MAKTFRLWDVEQGWLLPPLGHEFVPPGQVARFVRDTVREALDLWAILETCTEERGFRPCHPGMMVALLLHGCRRGLSSSRRLARACEERMDVMAATGLDRPDFRTIADFRERQLSALSDLFVQVLRLVPGGGSRAVRPCGRGRHQAEGQGRAPQGREPRPDEDNRTGARRGGRGLAGEPIRRMRPRMTAAAPTGAATGCRIGWPIRGEAWRRSAPPRPRSRPKPPIRPIPMTRADRASSGMRWQGRPLRGEDGGPPDRAQRSLTDPDSRIRPTRDGFIQGYTGQIAADAAHQVIVAHRLVATAADCRALVPLVGDIPAPLGRKPREVSGDAGFATEAKLAAPRGRRIEAYPPPDRARHGEPHAAGRRKLKSAPLMRATAKRLKRAAWRSRHRPRKQGGSRCSGRGSRPEVSGNSCCGASIRSGPNGP